jgi:hypothetical protein
MRNPDLGTVLVSMELSVGEVVDFIHHPGADIYSECFNIETARYNGWG